MGKYFVLITTCGISMFVVGTIAGLVLYVHGSINDSTALIVLTLLVLGITISGIGLKLLNWRNGRSNKGKRHG